MHTPCHDFPSWWLITQSPWLRNRKVFCCHVLVSNWTDIYREYKQQRCQVFSDNMKTNNQIQQAGLHQALASPPSTGARNKPAKAWGNVLTESRLKPNFCAFVLTNSICICLSWSDHLSKFVWSNLHSFPCVHTIPTVKRALYFLSLGGFANTKGWLPKRVKSPLVGSPGCLPPFWLALRFQPELKPPPPKLLLAYFCFVF